MTKFNQFSFSQFFTQDVEKTVPMVYDFENTFNARYVRLYTEEWKGYYPCARLEIKGRPKRKAFYFMSVCSHWGQLLL